MLFGLGSVVSQDGEREKIGNRPTHPKELVCPQRVLRVQRMKRHTTTVHHCNTEGDKHRETEKRKRICSEKGWKEVRQCCCLSPVLNHCLFKLDTTKREHWKCVDILELSNFACACMSFAQGHGILDQPRPSHLHYHMLKTVLFNSRQKVSEAMYSKFSVSFSLPCFLHRWLDKCCCIRWTAGLSLCLLSCPKH